MSSDPPSTIARYRVLRRLDAGAQAEVYHAEDPELGRPVALKVVQAGDLTPEDEERLREEARTLAAFSHPGIATLYELGESDGSLYLAMEYVDGETLAERIRRGPLPVDEAVGVALAIAEALAAAHRQGWIHRDVKSANVMLGEDDPGGGRRVKLLDFGLAGRLGVGGGSGGTPGYMAPEEIRGATPVAPKARLAMTGERGDLFSLGVVLYEMLAGRRPFEGAGRGAVLRSTLDDPPPPLGRDDVPLVLEDAVRRALAKEPRERFASADEFAAVLRRLKRGEAGPQEAPSPETSPADRGRRLRAALVAAALVGGVLDQAVFSWGLVPGWIVLGLVAMAAPRLLDRLDRRRTAAPRPAGMAFRGLAPFHEADRDAFFGRDVEVATLAERLATPEARFTVLFGESGSGKTSLVRAGLLPRLRESGALAIYVRGYADPVAAAVAEAERQTAVAVRPGEPALDYLRRVQAEMETEIVLVFDQFEEFFIHFHQAEEREPLLAFLAACHEGNAAIKVLLALRSDFLYLINAELEGRIPEPLASTKLHALKRLGPRQAEEILRRSAARAHLPLAEELVRHLVRDLDAEGGAVLPTELQIVGEEIQTKRILTLPEYRRAGGKEALVHAFLEDVIRASPDADGARLLLTSLVSDENTRLALPLAEIAHRTQRSRKKLAALLEHFVRERLVREIQEDEPWRYELQHEYLIDKIHQASGRVMDARQRANRLFRQHLASHAVDGKARIPLGQLWFIRRYSDVERSERARRLLVTSLRWGLVKVVAVGIVLVVVAAVSSIREEWQGVRLRDGHTAAVRRAVFSPDGRLLFTAGEDGAVMVWDFVSRHRLQTLRDHQTPVIALAASPDGRFLASGDDHGRIMIWDTGNFERVSILEGNTENLGALAFSTDGRWLVSTAENNSILWSTADWLPEKEISFGQQTGTVVFSDEDQKVLLTQYLWDLKDNEVVEYTDDKTCGWCTLSPDGSQTVGIDSFGVVRFFRLTTPADLTQPEMVVERRAHFDHGRATAFSPDGRWAATGSEDVVLWDAESRAVVARLEHTAIVWALAFSPDGRFLVSTHGDGAVLVWDVADRQRVADLREHSAPVRGVAFSPDGRRLASAGEDRTIIIWELAEPRKEAVLHGHNTRVNDLEFSVGGDRLVSVDQDHVVILWDVATGKSIWREGDGKGGGYTVALSGDERWVVTGSGILEGDQGTQVVEFADPRYRIKRGGIYGLAFSSDGRLLATVSAGGVISLWARDPWRMLEYLEQHPEGHVVTVSFSPDGDRLVTGNDNGDVRLWPIDPLRLGPVLGRHTARVKSVAFSPDGRYVASAGDDQTIRLWDVRKRRLIRLIGTHTAPTLSVAFSPDGQQIAVGGHDHSVRVYTRHQTIWGYELP